MLRASQPVQAAELHRKRELHLQRLAVIENKGHMHHRAKLPGGALRAGAGPPRPWAERPAAMPRPTSAKAAQAPCAKGAPRPAAAPRPHSAAPARLSRPGTDFAYREHQRNVAALYQRLNKVHQGIEWHRQRNHEAAMAAGRARHTTRTHTRRQQNTLAEENAVHERRLKHMPARFATPAEIALLTGKPLAGAGGGDDDGDDDGE